MKKIYKRIKILPCSKCGCKPVWGACFLTCPKCNKESDYNYPRGSAAKSWNKLNTKVK